MSLEPAQVDTHTGYRYYTTSQVPTAQVIRRFRDLGMPVREVLATTDPEARSALIAGHLERLENQLDQTRAAVASLRRLLRPAAAPIEVEHRAMPATTTAAIRAPVDQSEVLDWYDGAMAELDRTLRSLQVTPTGPSGGLYDNEPFTDEHGDAVVYVPVADPRAAGGCSPSSYRPQNSRSRCTRGPHDDTDRLVTGTRNVRSCR